MFSFLTGTLCSLHRRRAFMKGSYIFSEVQLPHDNGRELWEDRSFETISAQAPLHCGHLWHDIVHSRLFTDPPLCL